MDNDAAVKAFNGRLQKASNALRDAGPVTLERAALLTKQALLDAPGAPRFLRGVGTRGAKTTVRYKVLGGRSAVIRWYGPAHLVNNPTKPHSIKPRARRGHKALKIGDGFANNVGTMGTEGKHFYEIGREVALARIPQVHRDVIHSALRSIYQGD